MASEHVLELTEENWDQEVVRSDKPVLVDFWAPWCGPCRQLGVTIDKIAAQFAGRVKVGKVNIDRAQEVASKYGITSIPQVLLFKGDEEPREKLAGLLPESRLVKLLEQVLAV